MSVYRKYTCPCGYWKRSPGKCQKCDKPLESSGWGYQFRDEYGSRKTGTARTKVDAQRAMARHIDKGKLKPTSATLVGLIVEYIELVSSKHSDGGSRIRSSLKHIEKYFKSQRIQTVQNRDILGYIGNRNTEGAAAGSIQKEITLLKSAWKFAKRNNLVEHDPFIDVSIPSPPQQPMRPVSLEDEERLWKELPASSLPYYQFIAYTGCRMTEALNPSSTSKK